MIRQADIKREISGFRDHLMEERALVRRRIVHTERDIEECDKQILEQEEELLQFEERYQSIRSANEVKLKLAKARLDRARVRRHGASNSCDGGNNFARRASDLAALSGIAEGNEESSEGSPSTSRFADVGDIAAGIAEEAENADENTVTANQDATSNHDEAVTSPNGDMSERDALEDLARTVVEETEILRFHWQKLCTDIESSVGNGSCSPTADVIVETLASIQSKETNAKAITMSGNSPSTPPQGPTFSHWRQYSKPPDSPTKLVHHVSAGGKVISPAPFQSQPAHTCSSGNTSRASVGRSKSSESLAAPFNKWRSSGSSGIRVPPQGAPSQVPFIHPPRSPDVSYAYPANAAVPHPFVQADVGFVHPTAGNAAVVRPIVQSSAAPTQVSWQPVPMGSSQQHLHGFFRRAPGA